MELETEISRGVYTGTHHTTTCPHFSPFYVKKCRLKQKKKKNEKEMMKKTETKNKKKSGDS